MWPGKSRWETKGSHNRKTPRPPIAVTCDPTQFRSLPSVHSHIKTSIIQNQSAHGYIVGPTFYSTIYGKILNNIHRIL